MIRTFRAEKMLSRIKKEGKEYLLTNEVVEKIYQLDGKTGTDYNWVSLVIREPLVWISDDVGTKGTYVALCDCD